MVLCCEVAIDAGHRVLIAMYLDYGWLASIDAVTGLPNTVARNFNIDAQSFYVENES